MKQITSLWNGRVGCLAFCLCFKCWLGRDVRTTTGFHRRRLLIWTNALQPCWALLWFSGFAEDLYFSTKHFILSCCECMNTHADLDLLLMGVFENCHSASPSSSTWDPASCSFYPVFFYFPLFFFFFCSMNQEQFLCHSGPWGDEWHSHLNHPEAAVAGYLELGLTESSIEQRFADAGTPLFTLFVTFKNKIK